MAFKKLRVIERCRAGSAADLLEGREREEEADGARGMVPQLPLDVLRFIWSQLSCPQLVHASWVSREWRREFNICSAREEAVKMVTAPAKVPCSNLSRPQQAFRALQRILSGKNPFTGKSMPALQAGGKTWKGWGLLGPREPNLIGENGLDQFAVQHQRSSNFAVSTYELFERQGPVAGVKVSVKIYWRYRRIKGPYPQWVSIYLQPQSQEECFWMQGLLLSLTGGFQGLLRDGNPSSMPGSLALCEKLLVCWDGLVPVSKCLWPLRRAHRESNDFYFANYGPHGFQQAFTAQRCAAAVVRNAHTDLDLAIAAAVAAYGSCGIQFHPTANTFYMRCYRYGGSFDPWQLI